MKNGNFVFEESKGSSAIQRPSKINLVLLRGIPLLGSLFPPGVDGAPPETRAVDQSKCRVYGSKMVVNDPEVAKNQNM